MGDALEAVEEVCLAPLGLGIANGACAFLVVHSSALESARRSLGLAPHGPFHVTLGFKERDVHSIEKKGLASVVEWWPRAGEAIEADFQSIRSISIKGHRRELLRAVLQISRAASSHATALKAALLLGDKPASDAELEALSATDIVEGHYLRAKHDIGKGTGGSEAAHFALRHIEGASVSPDDARIMWLSKEARAASLQEGCSVWSASGGSVQLVRMPLNSVPLSVAGSAELWGSGCPSETSAKALKALGFTRVVTLTEEPLRAPVIAALGPGCCSVWHRPMPDRGTPPTVQKLVESARTVQRGLGPHRGPVLVHCLGGRGRTALVLAAILMLEGQVQGPSEALARVRGGGRLVRVTHPQVNMLKELYAVLAAGPGRAPRQKVNAKLLPRLIILCGRPGAGKSTFALNLVVRLPPGTVVHVNQDELGKAEADAAWARAAGQGGSLGSTVVLDNCCTTRALRRYALDLCNGHKPVLVHFTANAEVCTARAQGRGDDHVGGVGGTRAARIVEAVDKLFEEPSLDEGFKAIIQVTDDASAEALLSSWGCLSPEEQDFSCELVSKFPRTMHLVDLGSATRDDLRIPDATEWLSISPPGMHEEQVIVEEKVDGANLGFRVDRSTGTLLAQNRSHFVNSSSHAQFKMLGAYAKANGPCLRDSVLRDEHLVLYGEWLHLKHSVGYDALPGGYFVAFDLRCLLTDTWASRDELEAVLSATSVPLTPLLLKAPKGSLSLQRDVLPLVRRKSSFATDAAAEGVYVRMEANGCVTRRAKIVRPDFIAGNARWNSHAPTENTMRRVEHVPSHR